MRPELIPSSWTSTATCLDFLTPRTEVQSQFLVEVRMFSRTFAATVLVAFLIGAAAALQEEYIKCKVCERAIQHVWNQGVELRAHCKGFGSDPRCDHTNMHQFGIEEMVHEVCDKLPKTHQAIEESEFDLVLHEDPQHEDHVRDAIYKRA